MRNATPASAVCSGMITTDPTLSISTTGVGISTNVIFSCKPLPRHGRRRRRLAQWSGLITAPSSTATTTGWWSCTASRATLLTAPARRAPSPGTTRPGCAAGAAGVGHRLTRWRTRRARAARWHGAPHVDAQHALPCIAADRAARTHAHGHTRASPCTTRPTRIHSVRSCQAGGHPPTACGTAPGVRAPGRVRRQRYFNRLCGVVYMRSLREGCCRARTRR